MANNSKRLHFIYPSGCPSISNFQFLLYITDRNALQVKRQIHTVCQRSIKSRVFSNRNGRLSRFFLRNQRDQTMKGRAIFLLLLILLCTQITTIE